MVNFFRIWLELNYDARKKSYETKLRVEMHHKASCFCLPPGIGYRASWISNNIEKPPIKNKDVNIFFVTMMQEESEVVNQ